MAKKDDKTNVCRLLRALGQDTIFFSAGRVGVQVEMKPEDLGKIIRVEWADVIV